MKLHIGFDVDKLSLSGSAGFGSPCYRWETTEMQSNSFESLLHRQKESSLEEQQGRKPIRNT